MPETRHTPTGRLWLAMGVAVLVPALVADARRGGPSSVGRRGSPAAPPHPCADAAQPRPRGRAPLPTSGSRR